MNKVLSFLFILACISCSSGTAVTNTAQTKTVAHRNAANSGSVVNDLKGVSTISYTSYADYVGNTGGDAGYDAGDGAAVESVESGVEDSPSYNPNSYYTPKTDDMMLVYYGNKKRMKWGKSEVETLVMHQFTDGHREWLFPSFLYLEFKNDEGYKFGDNQPGEKGASNKGDWEWLLNRYFSTAYNNGDFEGLKALDECIEDCKKILGQPAFRHKVYLAVPSPCTDFTEWGSIKKSGRTLKLDFRNREHRLEAVKWFVDELLSRFNAQHYKNITLEGLYWIEETTSVTSWHKDKKTGEWTNMTGEKYDYIYESNVRKMNDIIADVTNYIHSKGYKFYWIPFDKSYGNEKWKTFGFDRCDMQTAYFWSTPDLLRGSKSLKTMSDVRNICTKAIASGMGMEFELSTDLLVPCYGKLKKQQDKERPYDIVKVKGCNKTAKEMAALGYKHYDYNPCLLERLKNLITVFEEQGVFERCNISYYESLMIRKLCISKDKEIIKIFDRLARHVSQRNRK